jgi:hypothetical protein
MLNKLLQLYPDSILTVEKPEQFIGHYHWFSHGTHEWIGIPKKEMSVEHLELLKTIFTYYQPGFDKIYLSSLAQKWYTFLFEDGSAPPTDKHDRYRFIYFSFNLSRSNHLHITDFEAALQGFFDSDITIIWENDSKGIIIESFSKYPLNESDFEAMHETLKSDLFIEPTFYIGKFRVFSGEFLLMFQREKSLFDFSLHHYTKDKIFTFEKHAIKHSVYHLPEIIKTMIQHDIIPVFQEDKELFTTIKNFLQNNMNASITAKKLYIHRNTLQYRLDRFAEKTGILLKDFYSAMTVYIACLLFEQEE